MTGARAAAPAPGTPWVLKVALPPCCCCCCWPVSPSASVQDPWLEVSPVPPAHPRDGAARNSRRTARLWVRDGLGGMGPSRQCCWHPWVQAARPRAGRSTERQLQFQAGCLGQTAQQGKPRGCSLSVALGVLCALGLVDAFHGGTCKPGAGWDGAHVMGSTWEKGTLHARMKP